MQSNCSEKTKIVIVGLTRIPLKGKTIHTTVSQNGSGKTVSLQPMGTSLSSAAKTVRFVSL